MLASLSNAFHRIGGRVTVSRHPQAGKVAIKVRSSSPNLVGAFLTSNARGALKKPILVGRGSSWNFQRRLYSSGLKLIEEQEEGMESVNEAKGRKWLEESAEEEENLSYNRELSSVSSEEGGTDWKLWHQDLHGWLSALHMSPMTMEMAKLVWSDYRSLVGSHPEMCQFLPLMFRQLSPYLYFDHLESLYSDIVVTGNLTTVIGRDMVKLYTRRGDLQNAEVIVEDLRQANLDVSGSTLAMLVRLNGHAGNVRKVWQYFDEQVTKEVFRNHPFPYLLGSLFLALRHLPGSQEAHVLSLFHLMASGDEYHPNSPEYYRWLESKDLQEPGPNDDVPDFPIPDPVHLPAPDTFCFSAALLAVNTVHGARIIWEYAQKLRRVTQHVWANYIICLSGIDIAVAVHEYRQFSLTGYAEKGWNTSAKLRAELISRCVDANDLDSLNLILEEKLIDGSTTLRDATATLTILLRKGETPENLLPQVLPLCERFKLQSTAFSYILRMLILEYLKQGQPKHAEAIIDYMLSSDTPLHYHHWTPLPLWYLHQWIGSINLNANKMALPDSPQISEEEAKSQFEAFHRRLMSSSLGPSSFYICAVAMNHPSEQFVLEMIDEAITLKIVPLQILSSLIANKPPFDRAYKIIQHLAKQHNIRIEPIAAQQLVRWAAQEKKYAAAFEITQNLVDSLLQAFKEQRESGNGVPEKSALHIKGSWIFNFSTNVLNPLGISSPLHAYYRYNKYGILNEDEVKNFNNYLHRWLAKLRKEGFKEKEFTYRPDQAPPHPHPPKLDPKFRPKHSRISNSSNSL